MACNKCGHTMQNLGLAGAGRTFYCPRCGSLKTVKEDGFEDFESPKLVERVEKLFATMLEENTGLSVMVALAICDIAEAVGKQGKGKS